MEPASLFSDCRAAGREAQQYQEQAIGKTLAERGVPWFERIWFRNLADSVLGNPGERICRWTTVCAQMLTDIRKLVEDRDMKHIEAVLERYNFSPDAEAIEINGTVRISHGLLRNYLLAVMEKIQPMFSYVQPQFSQGNKPLESLNIIILKS
jgi:hypothetical protein